MEPNYERFICPHCKSIYRGKRIVLMENFDFVLWNELCEKQIRECNAVFLWYFWIIAIVAVLVAVFYVVCIFTVKMPVWFFMTDHQTMVQFSFGEVLVYHLLSFVIAVLPFVIYVFLTKLFFKKCLDPWLEKRFPPFEIEINMSRLLRKYGVAEDRANVRVVSQ
ncbi:MAG: hypothetical protein UT32_C0026G0013 [Parcubacteria group bacterium GW2011_GWC2_39_14]|nr:MAG: hypothetical protein UT32_C0026G0013 [Parcubacteria group bacterium GW2011_GWC2_39_14]KKR53435.1 MAG: hypothetical protein UT91_C0027G0013 [Parcubacteria group bacterium GW2011_GWA2_40_23]